jgi:hypothetical protein
MSHLHLAMSDLLQLSATLSAAGAKITQLFAQLELFSEGEPPAHTLFVQGQPTLAEQRDLLQPTPEQLLLIDPPSDVAVRFRLPADTAALFTSAPNAVALPLVQTKADGVAHLRIGQHFLDLYAQPTSVIIYLPALGILCGGDFGSDAILPSVATGSTGEAELGVLRLLVHLTKQRRFQLYIPRMGTLSGNRIEVIERLAADVAYLHGLRRVALPLAQQGAAFSQIETVADSLLPPTRRTTACQRQNLQNLRTLYEAVPSNCEDKR